MYAKQSKLQSETRILDSRIEGLDLDERAAVRRCDWSAARNVVLVRAPLKEARQRTGAPKQR
jgi:hypothetical protein